MHNVITSHKTFVVDVDDTLILWDTSKYLSYPMEPITINFAGHDSIVYRHEKNINVLKKFRKLGYKIIVWSQTGYDWAEAVGQALGINDFVDLYMTKPRWYLDDKPVETWMSERIWRDPITGDDST